MTMTVGELKKALEGVDEGMQVLVRVAFDDGDGSEMGGATDAGVDYGCSDTPAFVIDGDEEEFDEGDEEEKDAEEAPPLADVAPEVPPVAAAPCGMPDLESVYDEQIAPLMTKIAAICEEHEMPMLAQFRYSDEGYCTSAILDGPHATKAMLGALRLLKPPPPVMLAITKTTDHLSGRTNVAIRRVT